MRIEVGQIIKHEGKFYVVRSMMYDKTESWIYAERLTKFLELDRRGRDQKQHKLKYGECSLFCGWDDAWARAVRSQKRNSDAQDGSAARVEHIGV